MPNITGGNRDPRVFWYKPGRHWVLALYVAESGRHNVVIFNSPDLKRWKRVVCLMLLPALAACSESNLTASIEEKLGRKAS